MVLATASSMATVSATAAFEQEALWWLVTPAYGAQETLPALPSLLVHLDGGLV